MKRYFAAIMVSVASFLVEPVFAASPLAQLTPITGTPVFFDAKKITAVVALPTSEFRVDAETLRLSPQIFFPVPAELSSNGPKPPVTQVLGIFANLMPVKESVDDVLKLAGRDQFVQFTLLSGDKVWMRASAIGWLSREYPAAANPGAGSYLGLGLAPGRPTAVKEDVDTARKAIEQALPN
ncbi:hypothetical protein [Bradyrhizobium sp. CCGUVB23]|uniref:hypothetical protein n=1 Tax=Bradyrhizobium sp. CCGUVB23 TaxID=2949630 RepID=UPI0020B247EA|nr:hypothetical protein [Bradyrhizobium sp. CCGUVB23]MCP3460857.1 hypothetical protein [Bradyrhizobium sp. CCGUVB23]